MKRAVRLILYFMLSFTMVELPVMIPATLQE